MASCVCIGWHVVHGLVVMDRLLCYGMLFHLLHVAACGLLLHFDIRYDQMRRALLFYGQELYTLHVSYPHSLLLSLRYSAAAVTISWLSES